MEIEEIESFIGKIPDFPKPGILFYDISTLISNGDAFASSLDKFEKLFTEFKFDSIAAIDARGFIFGSALANKLKLGMMMIRKYITILILTTNAKAKNTKHIKM